MSRTKMSSKEKTQNKAVRDYLSALTDSSPKRGRRRTLKSVKSRISTIETDIIDASPTKRLDLIQERLDLEGERDRMMAASSVDMNKLQTAFLTAAADYGSRRGISYAAWREVGVPAAILKAAEILRNT